MARWLSRGIAGLTLLGWVASAAAQPGGTETSPDAPPQPVTSTARTDPAQADAVDPVSPPDSEEPPGETPRQAPAAEAAAAQAPEPAVASEPTHGDPPASESAETVGVPQAEQNDGEPAEPTAEDTAALLASLGAEEQVGAQAWPKLNVYGFADFAFYKYFIDSDSALRSVLYDNSAFALGNLNVYLSGDLGEGWETLSEVRFTYLPNGHRQLDGGVVERVDTEVADYTNFGRPRRVGGIFIERAWLQYSADPLLTIRGGSWLTPYGIWNVDHGSPTIIPVVRPYVIGFELLPESQTGILVSGTGYPTDAWSLGYSLGLSNGRGPVQAYADLDLNKAVTARVQASHRGVGSLALGVSGYYGRSTDLVQTAVANGVGARIEDEILEQFDELSVGLDVRYTRRGFHSQAEFIINQRKYTEEGRPQRTADTFEPDVWRYGGYGVLGYRYQWLGLMPYVTAEYFAFNNPLEPTRPPTNDSISVIALGLNSRPTHNVTLKMEALLGLFFGDIPEGSAFDEPVGGIQGQAAWAF